MAQPSGGKIFWSPDAQQFYQEGRPGAISRLEGIESLHVTMTDAGPRYYDAFGTRVPNPENIIPQSMVETFVGVEREMRSTSIDVYNQPAGPDQFYKTWFIFHDQEGAVHLGYKNGRVGSILDDEVERAKMIAQIGDELEIDQDSEDGGSSKLDQLITATFHFIVS